MLKTMFAAATAALMIAAAPVAAQEWPLKAGNYWEVSEILVKDGGDLKYATHLANVWVSQMEMLKARGQIKEYHILENLNPRQGEATYALIQVYDKILSNEESEKLGAEMRAAMKTSIPKMVEESGNRAEYRTVMSSSLWGERMKR